MIVLAGLSVRALAEAGAADGMAVLALDLFGDIDTRRAATHWESIAAESGPVVDERKLMRALLGARGAQGWVPCSGFEGRPDLLERGARALPLLGTAPGHVAAVRDPKIFFGFLDSLGLAHPEVCFTPPRVAAAWLQKDGAGCGGWQVRRADGGMLEPTRTPGAYWQLEVRGTPMSATLLCNGREARVLGFNQQWVQAVCDRPFVFCGVIGPVPVAAAVAAEVARAAQALSARFELRGLASLDFMLLDGAPSFLELNPRPPASLSLYPRIGAAGALTAHVRACQLGELPVVTRDDAVRGQRILFATRGLTLTDAQAAMLAARCDLCDVPGAGARFEAGQPVCTLRGQASDAAALEAELTARHQLLLDALFPPDLLPDKALKKSMETCL